MPYLSIIVPIEDAFIVDDREAAIVFPDTKDEVDMTTLFVGEDSVFCEWC